MGMKNVVRWTEVSIYGKLHNKNYRPYNRRLQKKEHKFTADDRYDFLDENVRNSGINKRMQSIRHEEAENFDYYKDGTD